MWVVLLPSLLVPGHPDVGDLEKGSGWGEGGGVWRGEQVEGEGRDRTCGEEGEGHLCVCVCVHVCVCVCVYVRVCV